MDQSSNLQEDNELMYVYEWVDSVPLSRPKKNIARDFSDGGEFQLNLNCFKISFDGGINQVSYTKNCGVAQLPCCKLNFTKKLQLGNFKS